MSSGHANSAQDMLARLETMILMGMDLPLPAIRGQLAFDPRFGGPPGNGIGYWFLANMLINCISRPDFVAYCHETDKNVSFRVIRKLFRPVLVAWTVQNKETCQRLRSHYDLQIFEGFEP